MIPQACQRVGAALAGAALLALGGAAAEADGDARRCLVDTNATAETVALFRSLRRGAESGILIGQQNPYTHHHSAERRTDITDMRLTCGKVAALTEVGYRKKPMPADWFTGRLLKTLTAAPLPLAYLMFWYNSPSGYQVPLPSDPTTGDFRAFERHPWTRFAGDTPNPYVAGGAP